MMAPMSAGAAYQNPFEVTALEIAAARARSVFRSRHHSGLRQKLALSDALLDHAEHCRLEGRPYVSAWAWQETSRLASSVPGRLGERLGNNRHPDALSEVLFACQDRLLELLDLERHRAPAPVVPLFTAT